MTDLSLPDPLASLTGALAEAVTRLRWDGRWSERSDAGVRKREGEAA